jgi:subtilisin family serine protease
MNARTVALSLASIVTLAACADQPTTPDLSSRTIPHPSFSIAGGQANATDRHIVSFTNGVPTNFAARVEALGGQVLWTSAGARLAAVSGLSADDASQLKSSAGVADVQQDALITLERPADIAAAQVVEASPQSQSNPASAFFFARQWNMRAVHADVAWANGALGSPAVTVGILDTGIDYLYPDLAGLVDLNRSVDLLGTFDVEQEDGSVVSFTEADTVAKYFPGRAPFTDLFFHGTHVAATVSSKALVAAGVTSQTTLMAVKVCAYLNTCPFSSILEGVVYATDHGADVLNLSLGGDFVRAGNGRFAASLNQTFNYARSHGVTVVVSAGNAAEDLDHNGNTYATFCDTPAAVCVAATGPTAQASVNGPWTNIDAPASYTNFGRSAIGVAAPGGNNASFVWAACSETSLLVPVCGTGIFVIGAQGTSMASPHVAGTAALLVQQLGRNPGQIRTRLLQSADDLGQPGTDPFYGKGRLDVARALGIL